MKQAKKVLSVLLCLIMAFSTIATLSMTASASDSYEPKFDEKGRPISEILFYNQMDASKATVTTSIWVVSRPAELAGTPWELSKKSPITLKLRDDVNCPELRIGWLSFETKKIAPFTDSGYVLLNGGYKVLATYPLNAEGYEDGGVAFGAGVISAADIIEYKTNGITLTVTGDARYGEGSQSQGRAGRIVDIQLEYHDATEEIDFDSTGHWYACSVGSRCIFGCKCDADSGLINPVPHTYDAYHVCTVCGYVDEANAANNLYTIEFDLSEDPDDGLTYTKDGFNLNGNCLPGDEDYAFSICPAEGFENYLDVDVPAGAKLVDVTADFKHSGYMEYYYTDFLYQIDLGTVNDLEDMPLTGRRIIESGDDEGTVLLSAIGVTGEDNVIISSRDYENAEMYLEKVVLRYHHVFADAYTYDETGTVNAGQHWNACTFAGCEDHPYNNLENHEFVNGVCKCGATQPACQHTNTEYVDNGDNTHNKVCVDCEEVLIENEKHDFSYGNECEDCGAECQHPTGIYTDNGDGTHDFCCPVCCYIQFNKTHVFVNGVCVCGAKKPKDSLSLTIDGTIDTNVKLDLKYYAEKNDVNVEDLNVSFTYNSHCTDYKYTEVTETMKGDDAKLEYDKTTGTYIFTVPQAPAQIAETIDVKVFLDDGTELKVTHVNGKEYCDRVIDAPAGTYSAETIALCKATMLYAQQCKEYFSYMSNKTNVADYDVITDTSKYGTIVDSTIHATGFTVNAPAGVEFKGVTFMALANSAVRIYYTGKLTGDVSCEEFDVQTGSNDNHNYIEVYGIEGARLADVFTVKVGGTTVLTGSAMSYAYMANASGQASLENLAAALANYNNAAVAAFTAPEE